MKQAIELGFKRKDRAGHTEKAHEYSGDEPNRKMNIKNQLAHTAASYGGDRSVTTLFPLPVSLPRD